MDHASNPGLLQPSFWRRVVPLTGDASQRRYARCLGDGGRSAILVTYPPPVRVELARDLAVFAWCRDRGIRVPDLFAHDLGAGLALLEDLGDTDAERAIEDAAASQRSLLLHGLIQPLEVLAETDIEELPPWNPPLDQARMRWELAGFELWYLRHYRQLSPSPALGRWLDGLALDVGDHPRRVCHRDYHFNNLMVPADGSVRIIDIQDILIGPDTYDAISLLFERSAERLLTSAEQNELLTAWAENTRARPGWRTRSDAVRLQRGLKVLGSFARFVIAGRREYEPWLEALSARLAPPLEAAGAPPETTAILLD